MVCCELEPDHIHEISHTQVRFSKFEIKRHYLLTISSKYLLNMALTPAAIVRLADLDHEKAGVFTRVLSTVLHSRAAKDVTRKINIRVNNNSAL